MLGGLAAAHFDWAPNGVADNALQCFETAAKLFNLNTPLGRAVSFVGIGMAIGKELRSRTCPPSDERLFGFFVYNSTFYEPGFRAVQTRARLMLYHPLRPDARPFLNPLQTSQECPAVLT